MINVNSAVVASGSQANPALLADKKTPSTKLQARDLHANDANMESIVSRLLCQTKGYGNKSVKTGGWGGEQIGMTVNKNGASLEFGCASGSIDQPIRTNAKGNFSVDGTLTRRMGVMPADPELLPKPQDVTYSGNVKGNTMTLEITSKADGSSLGSYTLTYGQTPHIFYCA